MPTGFALSIDADFRSHVKVKKFARLMGDPRLGFGYLIALWGWAVDAAQDGDLTAIDIQEIEDGAGYPEADGRCYAALVAAGFIDETSDGRRQIHNWMMPGRTGHAVKQLGIARERWRKSKGITRMSPVIPANIHADSTRTPCGLHVDSGEVHSPSRFTVDPDPLSPGVLASGSGSDAGARSNGHARFTGYDLQRTFAEVRSDILGGLPWTLPPSSDGKADTFAARLTDDDRVDVRATMEKMLGQVKRGADGWSDPRYARIPAFAFGAWMSNFTGLREDLRGSPPATGPAAPDYAAEEEAERKRRRAAAARDKQRETETMAMLGIKP